MSLIPDIAGLEEYVQRRELNIAYVPVRAAPAQAPSAAWALDNYDYARARVLLRNLPRSNREGPYLLAALRPLTSAGGQGPLAPHEIHQWRATRTRFSVSSSISHADFSTSLAARR